MPELRLWVDDQVFEITGIEVDDAQHCQVVAREQALLAVQFFQEVLGAHAGVLLVQLIDPVLHAGTVRRNIPRYALPRHQENALLAIAQVAHLPCEKRILRPDPAKKVGGGVCSSPVTPAARASGSRIEGTAQEGRIG